jgi:hypothetical protein
MQRPSMDVNLMDVVTYPQHLVALKQKAYYPRLNEDALLQSLRKKNNEISYICFSMFELQLSITHQDSDLT